MADKIPDNITTPQPQGSDFPTVRAVKQGEPKAFLLKPIHLLMDFFVSIIDWFKQEEPRWQTLTGFILAVIIVANLFFQGASTSFGATYLYTQTAWNNQTSNNASDPADRSGWTDYSSNSGLVTGTNLTLGTAPFTATDDGTLTSTGAATGAGFGGGANSSTQVSGTGSASSVKLTTSGSFSWGANAIDTSTATPSSSIAMGPDGFPRMAYVKSSANLKYVQCTNTTCTTKNSTVVVASAAASTLAIGSDGFGRIAYFASGLKFVQCTNADCSTKNLTTIDTTNTLTGEYPSIAMGSDGFARISYYDALNLDLKFVQCTNADCSTKNITTVDSTNDVGAYTSLVINSNGFAWIVYANNTTTKSLKMAQCTNAACTTKTISTIYSQSGSYNFGPNTLKIGNDGFPRITSARNGTLFYFQCTSTDCSTNNSYSSLEATTVSFALGSDGLPRIITSSNNIINYYQCTTSQCSNNVNTTVVSGSFPYTLDSMTLGSNDAAYATDYESPSTLMFRYQFVPYVSSGTFTSAVIDTHGSQSWNNLAWTQSGGQTITLRVRSSNDAGMAGAPNWNSCADITNGSALSTGNCVTNGHQYIQYQATLSTADNTASPSLDSVTLGYTAYASSGNLISSGYNSGDPSNIMGELSWDENASLPAGTGVTISLRTADSSANLASASWSDFSNATAGCAKVSNVVTCPVTAIPANLKDSVGDQWFEYKVTLTGGTNTPQVDEVRIKYVVNARPEFNSTNGVTASQIINSSSPDWGKVNITYSIRDTDSSTGTNTPGFVTPSFEYNIGGGWVAIPADKLSTDATSNQPVNQSSFTNYSVVWDAPSQIPNTYDATAQIRVNINDNETANNTATLASSNFTLDTKKPVASVYKLDLSQNAITLNLTDDTNLQYRLSNNQDQTPDSLNTNSGQWQSPGASSINTTFSWNFLPTPNSKVYLEVRDAAGNQTPLTAVAPTQSNLNLKDIGDSAQNQYWEFISWAPFVNATGSTFEKYELYRSDDGGSTYNLITSVSNQNINYFLDIGLDPSVTYSWRLRTLDTDNDVSPYSPLVSDKPNGQGGTDTTPPTITTIQSTGLQATSATITWKTDELSDSKVEYSASPSKAYNIVKTNPSYLTDHSVVLDKLTPNTTYYFRVGSKDILNNQAYNDNSGQGFSFTTASGPIISGVTAIEVNEHQATIFWNTDKDSDSFVNYSISSNFSNPQELGSSTLVSNGNSNNFQHRVTLTGLSNGTAYYYQVKSTDESHNTSIENNAGKYYSFTTTTDNNPPVITNISVPVNSQTAAVVVWQTDEPATTQLHYGTATGVYTTDTTLDQKLTIYHVVALSDLTAGTNYYYTVSSADNAGNSATSDENTFTTAKEGEVKIVYVATGGSSSQQIDTTPPTISGIKVEEITPFGATIKFTTSEVALGLVDYGTEKDKTFDSTAASSDYTTEHAIKLSGLKMGTPYNIKIKALDKAGNQASSDLKSFTTTYLTEPGVNIKDAYQFQQEVEDAIQSALPSIVPPFVEKPAISNVTENSATLTFRTNIPAYSQASYAEDSQFDPTKQNPYSQQVSQTENKIQDHELQLLGLKPNTKYHVIAQAYRIVGAEGKSPDLVFVTKAGKVSPKLAAVTNSSFRIVWQTDEPANSILSYTNTDTHVTNQKTEASLATFHDMTIDHLTPGSTFDVKASSINKNGNIIEGATIRVTLSVDTTPPEINSIKIESAFIPGKSDKTQTIVSWKTNEPANSTVYYGEGTGSATTDQTLTNKVELPDTYVTDHSVVLTNLKAGGLYRIQVASTDTAGNTTTFPVRTVVIPRQSESVLDIIFKNFEDTFKFLKK